MLKAIGVLTHHFRAFAFGNDFQLPSSNSNTLACKHLRTMSASRKRQRRDSQTPRDLRVPTSRAQEQEEACPGVESPASPMEEQPQIAPQAMADETPFIE